MCHVVEAAQQVQGGFGPAVTIEGGSEEPADRVSSSAARGAGLEVVRRGRAPVVGGHAGLTQLAGSPFPPLRSR